MDAKLRYVKNNSLGILKIRKKSLPSNGENIIIKFLLSESIYYIREYFFKYLYNRKTNQLLYFDFYIPEYNLCIEFDGKQHYALNKTERNKENDYLKTAYCHKNKINLLRIRFDDIDNLEMIICKKIDVIKPISWI